MLKATLSVRVMNKLGNVCLVLGLSKFQLVTQPARKLVLTLKVVKSDTKKSSQYYSQDP